MPDALDMAMSPLTPSSPAPVNSTPTTRGPWTAAAVRNKTSIAGLVLCSFGPR